MWDCYLPLIRITIYTGGACGGREDNMENLAKAIIDSVQLFGQLVDHWANGQANIATNTPIPVGDTVSSIFGNLMSFLAQLSTQIVALMK